MTEELRTEEEAKDLELVFIPYITGNAKAGYIKHLSESEIANELIQTGLAYATKEEATRHAQQRLDDAKEKASL